MSTRGSSKKSLRSISSVPNCVRRRSSTRSCSGVPSTTGCPIARSRRYVRNWRGRTAFGRCVTGWASGRCTRPSIPAPRSSRPRRRTTTPATSWTRRPSRRWPLRPSAPRYSSWVLGPTVSARASNSTTAVYTRQPRCRRRVSRPSWSTAIRRRCPPTTTPPIASTSNR
ncbi:Uncharacterised protein [Mycobacteroides abscessus subsp. abscessus]|nr:Uncharacterised protein [Mycobacteroides abscessus subsp. abscessus]